MVPFWVPINVRHLLFRVPQKETIILITTHIYIVYPPNHRIPKPEARTSYTPSLGKPLNPSTLIEHLQHPQTPLLEPTETPMTKLCNPKPLNT